MSAKSCVGCKFSSLGANYSYLDGPVTDTGYRCLRRAPIVAGGQMSAAWTVWPIVKATDWCGEYEDRHAKVPS